MEDDQLLSKAHALYNQMRPLFRSENGELAATLNKTMLTMIASLSQSETAHTVTERRIYYAHALRCCVQAESFLSLFDAQTPGSELDSLKEYVKRLLDNTEPVPSLF
jgi:hypothetical protein